LRFYVAVSVPLPSAPFIVLLILLEDEMEWAREEQRGRETRGERDGGRLKAVKGGSGSLKSKREKGGLVTLHRVIHCAVAITIPPYLSCSQGERGRETERGGGREKASWSQPRLN